jgi:hypothetical protein
MRGDVMQAVMATWAARDLPARLDVGETAKLLGFAEHDVQILMASGKLTPLGDPVPNAPKWFAAMEIIQLAADHDWLNRATREVSKYWRRRRERNQDAGQWTQTDRRIGQKGSSVESSHGKRCQDGPRALAEDARTIAKTA